MILIADSGSTKCEWVCVDESKGTIVKRLLTAGINPFVSSSESVVALLNDQVKPLAIEYGIKSVYFYGAGAIFDKVVMLKDALISAIPCERVEVCSDMDGAARATIGNGNGIVCILGTGSNSCYYENGKATKKVPALGYILGDEGSGAVLGRTILSDILKGVAPEHLIRDFECTFNMSQAEIIESVYRRPMPNRFLASFAPFLAERLDDKYVYNLVKESFTKFLNRNVSQYPAAPIWFVGSIAYHFRSPLIEALTANGFEFGGIVASPIDGLVRYHSSVDGGEVPKITANPKTIPFRKITEEPSLYNNLEKCSAKEILSFINREDHRVADAVAKALPQVNLLVEQLVDRMKRGGRLFYMGAGTSGRLGVLDASEVPPTFGMPPTVVIGIIAGGDKALRTPVEGAEDDMNQGWQDLLAYNITALDTVVGIAASGTTPYVVGALRAARTFGCLTASISSNPDSPIAKEAEIAIETVVGPEVVTGSSRMKSGTAQKLVCNMITTTSMIGLGRVRGNRMVNMQLSNNKLVDRGTRMIVDELGLTYEKAKALLLIHGSVQKAVEAYMAKLK